METITLTVDKSLLEDAKKVAAAAHTTLDAALQDWLVEYTAGLEPVRKYDELMARLSYVKSGGPYTRDEMKILDDDAVARWVPVVDFLDGRRVLYPEGLKELLSTEG